MLRFVFVLLVSIFVIAMLGTIILDQFPGLHPAFEEVKVVGASIWNFLVVKYGPIPAILLVIGFALMIGSSKKI